MDVMQFTQALSRIWVLETRLLDKAKVERMLEANSADEVLKILGETEYANIMGNVKRAADYEEILSTELKRVYKLDGVVFLIIRFVLLNETYILMGRDLLDFLDNNTRKSIPYSYIKEKGYQVELKYIPRLDYLKIIDQIYFKGDKAWKRKI